MVTLWFYLFFLHGARQQSASLVFHSYLHSSLLSNGLSLPPPASAFLIPCLSLLLCAPLLSAFSVRCLRLQNLKFCLHNKNPLNPNPQTSSLPCSNTGELCKVRGSCLQEKSHHKEGNTDRKVPASVKKRSF